MPQFAHLLLVALLTVNVTGLAGLLVPEPCSPTEAASTRDGGCPPSCVKCGCCAQPAVPVPSVMSGSPEVPILRVAFTLPGTLHADPRDILHVPKPALG